MTMDHVLCILVLFLGVHDHTKEATNGRDARYKALLKVVDTLNLRAALLKEKVQHIKSNAQKIFIRHKPGQSIHVVHLQSVQLQRHIAIAIVVYNL